MNNVLLNRIIIYFMDQFIYDYYLLPTHIVDN